MKNITKESKVCGNCCFKSDGLNARTPNYCYMIDKEVDFDAPGCDEWRGSLRGAPLLGPEEQLAAAVANLDSEIGLED